DVALPVRRRKILSIPIESNGHRLDEPDKGTDLKLPNLILQLPPSSKEPISSILYPLVKIIGYTLF
ncbi:MAG: hypothetical protein WBL92_02760, partial [Methanothrix sp.]